MPEVMDMARISKPPEMRRQELLDTAMDLFAKQGYEETSMGDIAKAAGVAQGLCYRYFDSKQKLFQEAMAQYVRACCADFLPIIHDRSLTIRQRLERMAQAVLETDSSSQYSALFHRRGAEGQSLHEELSLHICQFLLPHVVEELRAACGSGALHLRCPEVAASYLLYGQIGLMGEHPLPLSQRVDEILRYADLILNNG